MRRQGLVQAHDASARSGAGRRQPSRAGRAALLCAGLLCAGLLLAGAVPAVAAQTLFDAEIAERIKGLPPAVRDQVRSIEQASRAKLMAVLERYGVNPDGPIKMDAIMKASKDLQDVAREEREAVLPLLKPEQRAQYNTIVAETTQRVRNAVK